MLAPALLLTIAFAPSSNVLSETSGIVDPDASRFTLTSSSKSTVGPVSTTAQDEEAESKPEWLGFQWEGGVSAGVTVQRGNTKQHTATASATARGRGERDRLTLGAAYIGGRSEINGNTGTTARQLTGEGKYDYFLNEAETTYWYANALAINDGVRDLDLLWSLGTGLGYQWYEKEVRGFFGSQKEQSFFTEVGVAYTEEDYEEPAPPTRSADAEYVGARVAARYDVKLSDTASAYSQAEWIPSMEDFEDDQLVRTKSGLLTQINGDLNAEFTVLFDWDSSPAAGQGRREVTYIFGLNWSF